MKSEIVTKPAFHPVTLAQVKAHLRVTSEAEDSLLANIIIPAAHREACSQLRRSIMLTTWRAVLDEFPCASLFSLPWPTLQSVTSIEYRDSAGDTQTFSADSYGVDLVQSLVYLKPSASWPATECTPGAVTITWKAGYSAEEGEEEQQVAVPEEVKSWILLRCGTLFEFREQLASGAAVSEIPTAAGLLDGERVWGF